MSIRLQVMADHPNEFKRNNFTVFKVYLIWNYVEVVMECKIYQFQNRFYFMKFLEIRVHS